MADKSIEILVLLTQEADPNLEATRRYFGKLTNGELYYRGIELRRHDYPIFLKKFETRLMEILFDAESVRTGKVPLDELVISKILRKRVNTYRSLFPHVVGAIQLVQKGKRLKNGEKIDFVYVNAEHKNPFRRVIPATIMDSGHQYYDRDKYVELVLDVAETVLSVFGFSRKQLGVGMKPKDYIEKIRIERSREIISELETLMWSDSE